ncbi:hypothetical protein ABIA41_004944 [Bradyrhizobium sp. USDA 313]
MRFDFGAVAGSLAAAASSLRLISMRAASASGAGISPAARSRSISAS